MLLGGIVILICYIPYLIIGSDSYILIHDYLDSYISHFKMLSNANAFFDYSVNIPVMGGLSRSCFDLSNWITNSLLFNLPLFSAIVINDFLVHFVAFIGMFLLLEKLINSESKHKDVLCLCSAICFASIPFYSILGISSAGIPLVFYAFYNLTEEKRIILSYSLIVLFCFFSYMILSGVFVGFVLVVLFALKWKKEKIIPKFFLGGLVLMGACYIVTNFHLFLDYFTQSNIQPHRTEFLYNASITSIIKNHISLFLYTQYHSGALITIPIIFAACYLWCKNKTIGSKPMLISIIIISIVVFCFVYRIICSHLEKGSIFLQFQFDRIYFLLPTLWIILFAYFLHDIIKNRFGKWVCGTLVLLVLIGTFSQTKQYTFYIKKYVFHKQEEPTFKQFFDVSLFEEIGAYINKPKKNYKIASIGMFPAIAQYSGFYCIDGYWNVYPLAYKHEFRKVIANELAKSEELLNYFDNWGSRCYIFSSELGKKYQYGKNCGVVVHQLDVNTRQLQKMGCQYVFSAVPIENFEELGWEFKKSFTTDNSFWKIFLYRIPDETNVEKS